MSISEYKIRKAKLQDLKQTQTLFLDTIKSSCAKDYNPEQINAWISGIENYERWVAIMERQYTIVAETNDRLLGFASLANQNYLDLLA